MPVTFNMLLRAAGLELGDVRLLRHQEQSAPGRSPYELWRDTRGVFERYQSIQGVASRSRFGDAGHWASFVVTPALETLFVGIYRVEGCRPLDVDAPKYNRDGTVPAGTCDIYAASLTDHHRDLVGRLTIGWGGATRAWIQRADNQDKAVVELRSSFSEPDFPGYQRFVQSLSGMATLPKGWAEALRAVRGVYLLTCAKTREQYVGSACGEGGLLGRWLDYVATNHGGNVALKSREASDYQVSILEVAGSAATAGEILVLEDVWKRKLQSREMGLNRN